VKLVPRSRWVWLVAALLSLGAASLAVEIAATGRTRPPSAELKETLAAYEAASAGPAAQWAKDELHAADTALREALLDYSRQRSRLFAWRDFRPVATSLPRASALAHEAERLGGERRSEARIGAEEAVRAARHLESHAEALVAVTTLPAGQRARLQRARLLVREAEALLRDGEVLAAQQRAERSIEELRSAVGPALEAAERYTSSREVATWRRWIQETQRFSRTSGEPAILVFKEKNLLILLGRGDAVRRYDAEVGANALGVKRSQGDRATPEGRYRIVGKKDRGQSRYHRALLLDYPNAADRQRFAAAQRKGEIPRGSAIGGLIEIHGDGGRGQNWTDGCVALSNRDMDDLFTRVPVGTRVTIVGGDGSDGAFSSLLARVAEPREARP
jgi:lipoprotein-anchoring transpeptidase ErfK/SrfK